MKLKFELYPVGEGFFILKSIKVTKKFTSFWTKHKINIT